MSKLSELVAVRVMGWTKERKGGWDAWWDYESIVKVRKCLAHYWNPDTSIADAWRVVDECKDCQPEVCTYLPQGHMCIMWLDDGRGVSATEETPELAIVVCALRVKGVPESEIEEARKQ